MLPSRMCGEYIAVSAASELNNRSIRRKQSEQNVELVRSMGEIRDVCERHHAPPRFY